MPSDRIKSMLQRFTQSQLRSAMADTPYVNTASGWKVDSKGDVKPGDPEDPAARTTRIAGLAGAALGQSLVSGMSLLKAYPALARAVDVVGNVDGIRNLVSNNGVRKTARLVGEGEYGKAALSAAGDALDVLGISDTARLLSRIATPAYRGYHTFNVLSPYSYDNPARRGKDIAKSMLLEKEYTEPAWKSSKETKDFLDSFYFDRDRNIASKVREDALAIYTGQPMRNNTYIKNPDGTYSFNLDEIQKLGGDTLIGTNYTKARNHDYIGHTHGGLSSARTSDVQIGKPIHADDGNVYTYKNLRIEDLWDLQPFSRPGEKLFADRVNTKVTDKIQDFADKVYTSLWDRGYIGFNKGKYVGKQLRKLRQGDNQLVNSTIDFLTDNRLTRRVDDYMKNWEAGKLLGGKPFYMRTYIPYTNVFDVRKAVAYPDPVGSDPLRHYLGSRDYYGYIDAPGYINPVKSSFEAMHPETLHPSAPVSIKDLTKDLVSYSYGGTLLRDYASGGKIHIKPSKRGTFTAAAKKHGKSVQAFASQVLAHKSNYSLAMVKKANFARNASKWHAEGGLLDRMHSVYGDDLEAMRKAIQLAKSK